ncbi:MAG: TonB-dependent receptor [Gammaproteobacteria bacterium]
MSRYGQYLRFIPAFLLVTGAASATAAEGSISSTNEAASDRLEEIVVSARRREENLQQVPISIQALSGDTMAVRGIQRVEDVVASTPNVRVGAGPSGAIQAIFSIRGIPGAGLFVDGIWQESNVGLSTRSVLELDRVEVLRGPQGTLYGRDTTGGAIRLYSKLPAETFGVRVNATVGSYDRRDISLNADIPITDTLFSKFSVGSAKTDGFVRSLTVDRSYGDTDNQDLRADLLWKPTAKLKIRLTADRNKETGTQANYTLRILDSSPPGSPIVPGFGFQVPNHEYYRVVGIPFDCQSNVAGCPGGQVGDLQTKADFNSGPGIIIDLHDVNLKFDYDITDSISLSSLSSYSTQTSWGYENFQNSNVHFFSQGSYQKRLGWTEELQLSGHEEKINWVTGFYAWHDTNRNHFMRWAFWEFKQPMNPNAPLDFADVANSPECTSWTPASGLIPCIPVPNSSESFTGESAEGQSVFGEFTYDLTHSLKATLGARYHRQTNSNWNEIFSPKTARQTLVPGELPVGDILASNGRSDLVSDSFSKATYRFALTNAFTPNLLAYVGFSQGYNAGGESRVVLPEIDPATGTNYFFDQKFAPETVDNYEAGLRSDWLDNTLRINATYFFTKWKDIQLQGTVHDPITGAELPAFLTQNAAAARAQGVELEINYRPSRHWLFNFDAGTLSTKYTSVKPGSEITLDSKFGQAPERQFSGGAQWDTNIGTEHELFVRADYNYTSGYDRSYVPGDQSTTYTHQQWEQPGFGLLAARIGFKPVGGKWEVDVFGTNLTDRRYTTGGFFSPLLQVDDGTIGRPREIGLTLKVDVR